MKTSTIIIAITEITAYTASATSARPSRSVIKCCDWTGACLPGSIYDSSSAYDSCKDTESSSMSCQTVCCEPFGAPTPTPSPNPMIITCKEKNELDTGYECDSDEVINDDKECCRWSGDCGSLSKCTSSTCCIPKPPTPSCTPSPSPNPMVITCEEKNELDTGYECDSDEVIDNDKECCRWSGDCGSLSKCTSSTCCIPMPPTPSCTPSPSPNPMVITCEEKNELDSGYTCDSDEVIDNDKECCRWSGDCGSLSKCTSSTCCIAE